MNKFTYCGLVAGISLLTACGSGGGGKSSGNAPQNPAPKTVSYEAYVVDDYVIGGNVEFFNLANNDKVAEVKTQELGKIKVDLDPSKDYRIRITGGFIDADGLNNTTNDREPFSSEITGLIGKNSISKISVLGSVSTGLEQFSQGSITTYEAKMADLDKIVTQYLSKVDVADPSKTRAALENNIILNKMTNFEQVREELRDDGSLNNSRGITTENAKALVSMAETSRVVAFADPALFACIQQKLKSKLAPTAAQLASITNLFCNSAEVRTLKGIEQLTNLADLDVSYNQISDLSILSSLPKLAWVNAMSNRVSDLSATANALKDKGIAINIADNCMAVIPSVAGVFITGGLDTQRETCGSVKLNLWAFQAVRKTADTLNLSYKLESRNNSGCKIELPNGSQLDVICDNKPHRQTISLKKTQENEIVRLLVGGKPIATYQVLQRIPVSVSISDYSPKQAKVDTATTFMLTGTGFMSGMGYTVEGCDTVSTPTITASSFSFTCTPRTAGQKRLIIKDQPNGQELYNKVVNISNAVTSEGYTVLNRNSAECVQDNKTGLIWEQKTDDGGLRDKDWTYSWYDFNPTTNGGFEGFLDYPYSNEIGAGQLCNHSIPLCNTSAYVAALNKANYCGYNDWRIPAIGELEGLVNTAYMPTIHPIFINTLSTNAYVSASSFGGDKNYVQVVPFYGYITFNDKKGENRLVRAVRVGQ